MEETEHPPWQVVQALAGDTAIAHLTMAAGGRANSSSASFVGALDSRRAVSERRPRTLRGCGIYAREGWKARKERSGRSVSTDAVSDARQGEEVNEEEAKDVGRRVGARPAASGDVLC